MTLEETKQAVITVLERQKTLLASSQKMADPNFNKRDSAQWAAIHADDEQMIAALEAALHWLNKAISQPHEFPPQK